MSERLVCDAKGCNEWDSPKPPNRLIALQLPHGGRLLHFCSYRCLKSLVDDYAESETGRRQRSEASYSALKNMGLISEGPTNGS
jgi:hypothetical protein